MNVYYVEALVLLSDCYMFYTWLNFGRDHVLQATWPVAHFIILMSYCMLTVVVF